MRQEVNGKKGRFSKEALDLMVLDENDSDPRAADSEEEETDTDEDSE